VCAVHFVADRVAAQLVVQELRLSPALLLQLHLRVFSPVVFWKILITLAS
jgi:hypothetical protein